MKAKAQSSSKVNKRTLAKKNAEAQKAMKKAARMAKAHIAPSGAPGKKGKSPIGQSKKKK